MVSLSVVLQVAAEEDLGAADAGEAARVRRVAFGRFAGQDDGGAVGVAVGEDVVGVGAVLGVDVEDDDAGGAAVDADVGVGVLVPPVQDLAFVAGGCP
jgi:hypothetical protein